MARWLITEHGLQLKLNPLEQIAGLRRSVRVRREAIHTVRVDRSPWDGVLLDADVGFAAGGAPGKRLITAGPRARIMAGAQVVAFVYLNRAAVVVEVTKSDKLLLLVASTPDPEACATVIRRARR